MPQIEVDDDTYELLRGLVRMTGLTASEVVRRGVIAAVDLRLAPPGDVPGGEVAVHVVYEGTRVHGLFAPATGRLAVTSPPLAGAGFATPTAAASAVVKALNPLRRNVNANGWTFWRVTATGEPISRLRARESPPPPPGEDDEQVPDRPR